MTVELKKIHKYLDKTVIPQAPEVGTSIVICADSKGNYLKSHIPANYRSRITWCTQKGRTTEEGVNFLEREIRNISSAHHTVVLMYWHGSCDITRKIDQFIYLKTQNESVSVNYWHRNFSRLCDLVNNFPNIKLCLLEIPPISTKTWNRTRDHVSWEITDDSEVYNQVHLHNEIVREYNLRIGLNFLSPKPTNDLLQSHKNKPRSKVRYAFNFSLLPDGVHPIADLARYWVVRILERLASSQVYNQESTNSN